MYVMNFISLVHCNDLVLNLQSLVNSISYIVTFHILVTRSYLLVSSVKSVCFLYF
jgi:hypothetical protein